MAGATGLEPAASGVTGRRSNQLSYAPVAVERGDRSYSCRQASVKQPTAGLARRARVLDRQPARFAFSYARDTSSPWWAMRDSNPRPPRCKRDALLTELIAP